MSTMGRTRRIHFVGIGGIGMSGIAELLANLEYDVSGSDARRSAITDRLATLGVRVSLGHDAANLGDADVVVVSSAVPASNSEVMAAHARRVPVIPRAEMLAELMRLRTGIAIAGAHGKTTTTSMIALMLERAGLHPTAVIGGRLSVMGSNAWLGRGDYMVAEADESDRSFLQLSPTIAVITNIDREHLEAYGSIEQLVEAFRSFAAKVPFHGAVVACVDDPRVAAVVAQLTRRTITYGLDARAQVQGRAPATDGRTASCVVEFNVPGLPNGAGTADLRLAVPGRHNLQNALAAVAVGLEVGVPIDRIMQALAEFSGADRRYQSHGTIRGVTVIDDYGHHPTEIAAVLTAARAGRPSRIVAVFQPHRFTRTRDLMDEFGDALAAADVVVLTDIYPAGEPAIAGVTIDALASRLAARVSALAVVPSLSDVPARVAELARPGDLVITLGAGSISGVPDRILEAIAAQETPA